MPPRSEAICKKSRLLLTSKRIPRSEVAHSKSAPTSITERNWRKWPKAMTIWRVTKSSNSRSFDPVVRYPAGDFPSCSAYRDVGCDQLAWTTFALLEDMRASAGTPCCGVS